MDSLWQKTVQMPIFPELTGSVKTDVLIIGGGIAGVLCAHMLRQAGIDYILVEQNRIGSGITGHTTAKITSQHGAIYSKMLQRYGKEITQGYYGANRNALRRYCDLCAEISCAFERKDSVLYEVDTPEKLEKEAAALDAIGAQIQWKTTLSLPFPVAGAVVLPAQAQFHPLKFLGMIATNCDIYENTRICSFDGKTYHTRMGTVTAEKVIVATHFPMWNKHGLYPLKLYQHRSYVIGLENAIPVDAMYMDVDKKGLSFRNAGELLLLGGGAHRTGKTGGGWEELERFAGRYYPKSKIRYRWATQDCMSLDDIPYIGHYSARSKEVYVATGFNKWGMSSAMVAAELLSDLVQGKRNPYEAVFSPQRRMLHPQLAVNAVHTVGNLLTPTKPRCPHMGCALKWNPQERSWDCPCHGSRFAEDGKVLDNPSNADLKHPPT